MPSDEELTRLRGAVFAHGGTTGEANRAVYDAGIASQSARIAELEAENVAYKRAFGPLIVGATPVSCLACSNRIAERDAVRRALAPALESMRRVAVHGGQFVMNTRECDELLALLAAAREGGG